MISADCLQTLRPHQPETGAVHASYVSAKEGAFGEVHFGWDAASGSWYFTSPPFIRGRAPDGRAYQGEPGKAFSFSSDDGSTALEGRFFPPLIRQLLQTDGHTFNCQSRPDGGAEISWRSSSGEFPGSTGDTQSADSRPGVVVTLILDPQGRVVSRTLDSAGQPLTTFNFIYPPDQQPGFEVSEVLHDFQLASYDFDPSGDLDRFDPVSVNSLAMTSALNIKRGLAADARKKMESQAATTTSNPITSYVSGQGGYVVPIIGTGLILLIVGILAARRLKR